MCRAVTCKTCRRPTWAGCGAHVEQVLGHVPRDQRCRCDVRSTATPTPRGASPSWFSRLRGRYGNPLTRDVAAPDDPIRATPSAPSRRRVLGRVLKRGASCDKRPAASSGLATGSLRLAVLLMEGRFARSNSRHRSSSRDLGPNQSPLRGPGPRTYGPGRDPCADRRNADHE
jgi:hypothetical protein